MGETAASVCMNNIKIFRAFFSVRSLKNITQKGNCFIWIEYGDLCQILLYEKDILLSFYHTIFFRGAKRGNWHNQSPGPVACYRQQCNIFGAGYYQFAHRSGSSDKW